MHVHRGKAMETRPEGSHLQAKERGLGRNQPCQHLDLGHPASRTVRSKFLLFMPPSLWYCGMATRANWYNSILRFSGKRQIYLWVRMGLARWTLEPKATPLETLAEQRERPPFPCRNSSPKASLKVSSHTRTILGGEPHRKRRWQITKDICDELYKETASNIVQSPRLPELRPLGFL